MLVPNLVLIYKQLVQLYGYLICVVKGKALPQATCYTKVLLFNTIPQLLTGQDLLPIKEIWRRIKD